MRGPRPRPELLARAVAVAFLLAASCVVFAEPTAVRASGREDTYYTYSLARQAWVRQDYPEALRLLHEAVAADPDSSDLRVELARLHLDLNQAEDATSELLRAIELSPESPQPRRLLADTLLTVALRDGADPALIDKTIEAYRETVRIDPADSEAYLNLGKLQASRASYPQALESFEHHLALEPLSEEGLSLAAQVLIKLDRKAQAVAMLADAVGKRPGSATLHLAYLDALEASGDKQGVEAAAAAMIQAGIEPLRAHFMMARLLSARGDHSGAYEHLSELSRILEHQGANVTDDDKAGIQLRMIQELIEAERLPDALELSRAGSRRFPNDIRFLLREGEAMILGGKPAEAETFFRTRVLGDSRDSARSHQVSDVYLAVGARNENAGRYKDAETNLRASIEWNPVNSSALNYLGFMLADRGERLDEAIKYIALALERDPANGAYLDSLGWAYYKKGDYTRAEKLLEEAVSVMVHESEIHDHLGDLYHAMGRTEDAINAWQKALDNGHAKPDGIRSKLDAARSPAPPKR